MFVFVILTNTLLLTALISLLSNRLARVSDARSIVGVGVVGSEEALLSHLAPAEKINWLTAHHLGPGHRQAGTRFSVSTCSSCTTAVQCLIPRY